MSSLVSSTKANSYTSDTLKWIYTDTVNICWHFLNLSEITVHPLVLMKQQMFYVGIFILYSSQPLILKLQGRNRIILQKITFHCHQLNHCVIQKLSHKYGWRPLVCIMHWHCINVSCVKSLTVPSQGKKVSSFEVDLIGLADINDLRHRHSCISSLTVILKWFSFPAFFPYGQLLLDMLIYNKLTFWNLEHFGKLTNVSVNILDLITYNAVIFKCVGDTNHLHCHHGNISVILGIVTLPM